MLPTLIFWMIVVTVWVWGYQQLFTMATLRGMEKERAFIWFIRLWPLTPIFWALFSALNAYNARRRRQLMRRIRRMTIMLGCDEAQAEAIVQAVERLSKKPTEKDEEDSGG